jgi:hypothetical protein
MKSLFVGGPWDGVIKDIDNEVTHVSVKEENKTHRYRLRIGEKKPVWVYIHEDMSTPAAYFEIQYDINLRKKVKQLIEELGL